jgi:16S rRNA (uracil1498-N3)-methyltransferase
VLFRQSFPIFGAEPPPRCMTTTFYAPPDRFSGTRIELPEDEARHAVRVLRHRAGDEIVVVDGAGGRFRVRLAEADGNRAAGDIVSEERDAGEPAYRLTIGLGLLKNPSRFETFAEKAVELGVAEIAPLVTERAERASVKHARIENILVAAMKQSGRSRLPVLAEPRPLRAMLEAEGGLKLICHEASAPEDALVARLRQHTPPAAVTVLVGPEGGFSHGEIEAAISAGWLVTSLGPRRLRAETAALAAAAGVSLVLGS